MFRNPWVRALTILVIAGLVGFYDFRSEPAPANKPATTDAVITWFRTHGVDLGLDLEGGAQLRYLVDLSKSTSSDPEGVVDSVRETIERRVNALGVSEPVITPSVFDGKNYLTVELPGTADINEAIERVGKTVLLDFREQREPTAEERAADEKFNADQKTKAQRLVDEARKGGDFENTVREENEANPYNRGGVQKDKVKKDVNPALQELVFETLKNAGDVSDVQEMKATNEQGVETIYGYYLVKLLDSKLVKNEVYTPATATATHILIGTKDANPEITRTKEEAKKLAEEVLEKAKAPGADLGALAREYSDDPSAKDGKADQGKDGVYKDSPLCTEEDYKKNEDPNTPQNERPSCFVRPFNKALMDGKDGDLVGPVETDFGYHIIKVGAKADAKNEVKEEKQVSFGEIFLRTRIQSAFRSHNPPLDGTRFASAIAQPDPQGFGTYQIAITFDSEGAKLFSEMTRANVGKPIAIYLDDEEISAPVVQSEITTGDAVITGTFTAAEATKLANTLNSGTLGAPLTLVDQTQVQATLGASALTNALKGGLFGLIILGLFMILYYRLPGLMAVIALTIYTLLLLAMFRLWPGYTLSLAGIAAAILSIGMAVDANVLIFERLREELAAGKSLPVAVEQGFRRAWTSIKDSNISSLITALILTVIGTSVVRGFALTLAIGIVVSMFTAIWVTRGLLLVFQRGPLARNLSLWRPMFGSIRGLNYTKYRKWSYVLSGVMVALSAIALFVFQPKLGLDFTGGSRVEYVFTGERPSTDAIRAALVELEKPAAVLEGFAPNQPSVPPSGTPAIEPASDAEYAKAQIIPVGEKGVLLKMVNIDQATYDRLSVKMDELNGGTAVERVRFETIGPTIGKTLKSNAIWSILLATLMIALYIAFAFRKVPKIASPWKFGVTAVIALLHDIFITVGFFAVMGYLRGWEMDTLFITALLTVFGFSVHDTIVVFDRIRENLFLHGRTKSLEEIADESVNQTLMRSINTSLTTLITLTALFVFGSETIRPFVGALIFGMVIGVYSSIFVAAPLLVDWKKGRIFGKK